MSKAKKTPATRARTTPSKKRRAKGRLTKPFSDTVRERAAREPGFRRGLLREAIECLRTDDVATGQNILRDLPPTTPDISPPNISSLIRAQIGPHSPDEYDWIAHEDLTNRIHHMAVAMSFAIGDRKHRERNGELEESLVDALYGLSYEIEKTCDEIMALRENRPTKKGGA